MSLTVLIAGGTGLIGTRLTKLFREKGHRVRLLSRTPRGEDQFGWDLNSQTIDERAVPGADIIINLTGAGIADKHWTAARKKVLIDSRVQSTHLLRHALEQSGHQPRAFLSSSAIGYYGKLRRRLGE